MNIYDRLFALRDEKYAGFHRRLVPGVAPDSIIGVRMPQLRALAKELDVDDFLAVLPHRYYEENQLHAIILSRMKDFDVCMAEVERFLPFVDNWATCDGLRPRCFARHAEEVLRCVPRWLADGHEYTVRFGIGVLEAFFLDGAFREEQLHWVAGVSRGEYYVRMMQAWYFATALAKQWEATLPFVDRLSPWVRAKTIQKAVESFRVSDEHKAVLAAMRR